LPRISHISPILASDSLKPKFVTKISGSRIHITFIS